MTSPPNTANKPVLKALLSAYACEPGKGSEPEVGWRWAISMARLHDVTVVTRSNNREPIEKALAHLDGLKPVFEYYDLPAPLVQCKKAGMPVALYYLLWQIGVRWHFRRRLRQFDVIHHVTFNSFRQPGFWWFCPVPVVLGPLGGGQVCPWRFLSLMKGRKAAELFRSCSVIATPLLVHVLASFSAASKILVANSDTEKRIPSVFAGKVQRMLETGVSVNESPSHQIKPGADTRLLWLSWLLPIKAPELAIRAFALACKTNPHMTLTMAGDGPLKATLIALADSLGVGSKIQWKGRVPREQVFPLLKEHDVFIFTSLRDTSGNVLLEAMAAGLPSVTLKHQGAAEIATDSTAIRVSVIGIEQTVRDIAEAMVKLACSQEERIVMGAAAQGRIAEVYNWAIKAKQMSAVYTAVTSK